ncbi:MAG: nitrogen regulation protein NR(I) [Rhodobiaceae bacterium]|nr:nitrogen regulation protein NR(I) [Rhodobiaceae bacterium]
MNKKTILLAEDDESVRLVTTKSLQDEGYKVESAETLKTLWMLIEEGKGNILISDVMMPDGELFDILPQITELRPELPVIVISAKNNLETAISATQKGAYEYLPKPFDLEELNQLIRKALLRRDRNKDSNLIGVRNNQLIIGRSSVMQDLYKSVARLSQNDLTVMIYGESGTGKELVAKALHEYSSRSSYPFIALNMAAIPKELIESELFGHEKGAFTGAYQKSEGKFKHAEKGTLFLDEIGDMPIDAQTRLLRVLQEGEFSSVGGNEKIKTDTRIIAATNKDLNRLINQGSFREDLYYRLNVVPINIPPLRERKEDIPELINHFLIEALRSGLSEKKIHPDGYSVLKNYDWPGNVRELENFILRISALYPEDMIDSESIRKEINKLNNNTLESKKRNLYFSDIINNYFSDNINKLLEENDGEVHNYIVSIIERALISQTLNTNGGNQLKAAESLGLNRNTLRKKIIDLNIDLQSNKKYK